MRHWVLVIKIILEGPKDKLDLTVNTQPAIFLISLFNFSVNEKNSILISIMQNILLVIHLENILLYVLVIILVFQIP